MKRILILALLSIIALSACSTKNMESQCIEFGGNWLEDHNECEGISAEQCAEVGGNFNECASACRHDPDAEICTLQCVQVCVFE